MAIVIISTFLPPDQNQPGKAAPTQTAPTQVQEAEPVEEGQLFTDVNNFAQEYQTADAQRKNDLISEIYNYPMGKTTIGSWLAYQYHKHHPQMDESAAQQARLLIWQAIDQEYRNSGTLNRGRSLEPVANIIGWLKSQIGLWGRRGQSKGKVGPESNRFTEYEAYLKPYMIGVRDHASSISPDLLEKVDNGEMKPEQAAWTQFKRNTWNDNVDPQTGKSRIDTAKEVFQQKVDSLYTGQINEMKMKVQDLIDRSKSDPNMAKKFDALLKNVLKTYPRFLELKSTEPVIVGAKINSEADFNGFNKMLGKPADFNSKGSPLYLTGTMFTERASPEMLSQMWSTLNSGPTESADAQEMDAGEGYAYNPSTEEGQLLPKMQDQGPMSKERKRTIIEQAPEEFLAEYNDDPEIQQKIQDRLHLIQPYVPARDKAGNPIMDGSRPRTVKNPQFKPAIESIINSMYGPGSMPRRVLDERGKPKSTPKAEERTKDALFQIGQFFANSVDDQRDEQMRLKELERNLAPYTQEPLALKHYDGPPLKASQQYALALREVMLDMMEYLGNDKVAGALEQQIGRAPAVAEFKRWIRTATFIYINRIIGA